MEPRAVARAVLYFVIDPLRDPQRSRNIRRTPRLCDPRSSRRVPDMNDFDCVLLLGISRNNLHQQHRSCGLSNAERVVRDEANCLFEACGNPARAFRRYSNEVVKNCGEVVFGALRVADDHSPARFHNARIRASSANCPRSACRNPASTADLPGSSLKGVGKSEFGGGSAVTQGGSRLARTSVSVKAGRRGFVLGCEDLRRVCRHVKDGLISA